MTTLPKTVTEVIDVSSEKMLDIVSPALVFSGVSRETKAKVLETYRKDMRIIATLARTEALEEAAGMCEAMTKLCQHERVASERGTQPVPCHCMFRMIGGYNTAVKQAAAAIRSLISKTEKV